MPSSGTSPPSSDGEPLTSIQPNFIGEGQIASELLERMMNGATLPPDKRTVKVGVKEVVFRDSTVSAISAAGKLVQRVLNYINKNALNGIGVPDIVRRLKVSRSLLELRFSEMQKESLCTRRFSGCVLRRTRGS